MNWCFGMFRAAPAGRPRDPAFPVRTSSFAETETRPAVEQGLKEVFRLPLGLALLRTQTVEAANDGGELLLQLERRDI